MSLFKKKLSEDQLLETLLGVHLETRKHVGEKFEANFGRGDKVVVPNFEVVIFTSWLMALSLPQQNSNFLERLHIAIRDWYVARGLEGHFVNREHWLETIDERFQVYFEAFRMWQQNPQHGYIIGEVMVSHIHNQYPVYSVEELEDLKGSGLEVNDVKAMVAFEIFSTIFQTNLEFIGKLKKEYKIKALEV